MFFWNSLAFSMIQRMLAIWSLVPLPFLKPAWISGSSRFTYCWSLAWRILSITLLACKMSTIMCWFEHSLALPFLGIGMKTDLFQSCGHCWVSQICWHQSFPNLSAALSQHHLSGFETTQPEFHHLQTACAKSTPPSNTPMGGRHCYYSLLQMRKLRPKREASEHQSWGATQSISWRPVCEAPSPISSLFVVYTGIEIDSKWQ